MQVIGMAGCSASGKTTLIKELRRLNDQIAILSLDNYYKPPEEQTEDANGILNFDLPSALHLNQCAADIQLLKSGRSVTQTEYTFNNEGSTATDIVIEPQPILIVEGLFVFSNEEILNQLDFKVFMFCPLEVCLQRRLKRDLEERGYDADDVNYRWVNHVTPSFNQYLAPHIECCDLVVDTYQGDLTKNAQLILDLVKV